MVASNWKAGWRVARKNKILYLLMLPGILVIPLGHSTIFPADTMLFSGGLIPTFMVVKQLNLLNTIWAIVLPGTQKFKHGGVLLQFPFRFNFTNKRVSFML